LAPESVETKGLVYVEGCDGAGGVVGDELHLDVELAADWMLNSPQRYF
jgi:hypothetical protein